MKSHLIMLIFKVHCHVGSLESIKVVPYSESHVHCHVGSLETWVFEFVAAIFVHCHVGSLEKIPIQ